MTTTSKHTQAAKELRQEALRRRQLLDESANDTNANANANATTACSPNKLFGTTTFCNEPATPTATTASTIGSAASTTRARRASTGGLCADRCLSFEIGGDRGDFGCVVTPRKEPVPRASDVAKLAPRSARDFVASNRLKVQCFTVLLSSGPSACSRKKREGGDNCDAKNH